MYSAAYISKQAQFNYNKAPCNAITTTHNHNEHTMLTFFASIHTERGNLQAVRACYEGSLTHSATAK
jgi:hypothetical protein